MKIISELMKLDLPTLIISIFIIMSAIVTLYNIASKFSSIIGKPFLWIKNKNSDHDAIIMLEGKMKEYSDNRIKDREQSRQIQKELIDAQNKISDSVNNIAKKIDEFKKDTNNRFFANEEKENKRVQAEIKDKIAQLYKRYQKTNKITDMELEALEDLISTYENHGGKNSFIHSIVKKEMYTWETN